MREWRALVLSTLLCVGLLVVLEWLFFVTKPSFLSILDWPHKFVVLGVSALPLLLVCTTLVAFLGLIALVTREERARRWLMFEARLVPTVVLGSLLILLLDNFTMTVFGFGIQRSSRPWSWSYAFILPALFVLAFFLVCGLAQMLARRPRPAVALAATLLLLSLLSLAYLSVRQQPSAAEGSSRLLGTLARQPNIILISGDGLNATHLSCYGYERETTPFLKSLVERSLLCENSFANSAHTGASMASILTGRLPTQTRVIYPPDILSGADTYRHLPGLLRKLGYRTMHMSARHYADAYDLNLRDGFDVSTYRRRSQVQTSDALNRLLGQEASYFVEQIVERVRSRVRHAYGQSKLPHAYVEVDGRLPAAPVPGAPSPRLDQESPELADERRIQAMLDFVEASTRPFFAHVHLMGTHGSLFSPRRVVFSQGKSQDDHWMTDFYDDAILEFDELLEQMFAVLEQRGLLSNTLVIVHSDHASRFDSRDRTPLLFVFPEASSAGRIRANAQNLDIAPTILDYLGVAPPGWMAGRSLLDSNLDPLRPIFSVRCNVSAITKDYGHRQFDPTKGGPPFYSMGRTTMIVCNRSFTIDWVEHEMLVQDIAGHTEPCAEQDLPTSVEAEQLILEHLARVGYEVSSVQRPLPVRKVEPL